jgi:xanthine dehydrogenase YagR molybdenum-binding subunit
MQDNRSSLFGRPIPRVDGVAKVTGAARFASDEPVSRPAFAYLVTSSIARGRIEGFKLERAKAVAGVLDILTHENVGGEAYSATGPDGRPSTTTLENDRIWHDGQIIALVIAETYEAAREAANKVEVAYAPEPPSGTFDAPGLAIEPRKPERGPDPAKGDPAGAFSSAAASIDAHYSTPAQHHNPIELFTSTCAWEGAKLTIYEPSQFMWGTKSSVAKQLKLDPDNVRAISRYVGGAFGSKGPNPRTAWIAIAAKRVGRPVKLVPTRDQGFTIATYRAETRQHVKLGASADGKLISFSHEGWEITSRPSGYNVGGVESTARMYACPNIYTAVSVVHADRNTPGYMRAPPETPYMFGLESAMDELAYELHMDPIELRRVNDTQTDPVKGLPFSSRSLMECFDQGAARFDWAKRNATPASMRDGEWLVGYGCAAACYPSNFGPAAARVSMTPDAKATVDLAGHEIGTGAYTVVAITAARSLGLAVDDACGCQGLRGAAKAHRRCGREVERKYISRRRSGDAAAFRRQADRRRRQTRTLAHGRYASRPSAGSLRRKHTGRAAIDRHRRYEQGKTGNVARHRAERRQRIRLRCSFCRGSRA